MTLLAPENLRCWVHAYPIATSARTVGVIHEGNLPLDGLQDLLAIWLMGHAYRGVLSSESPHLLLAFTESVRERSSDLDAAFVALDALWEPSDAMIAGDLDDDALASLQASCTSQGIEPKRRSLRKRRYGVGVLDGLEDEDERMELAEDVLLHEGLGSRHLGILWAPESLAPDNYLESFALFRGVFPAHSRTSGSLKMKKAFLEAVEAPHAYGEGLEFLMSKGPPEVQDPCHIRWATYRSLDEVIAWLTAHQAEIQPVLFGERLKPALGEVASSDRFGTAHRPGIDWRPDEVDVLSFLAGL
jgi:hypothetical protein